MSADSARHAASTVLGLAYCVPFVLWVAGQPSILSGGASDGTVLGVESARILVLMQMLVVALAVPCYARFAVWLDSLSHALLVVVVAWPLFTLLWLVGAAAGAAIARAEFMVLVLAAMLWCLTRIVLRPMATGTADLGTVVIQVVMLAGAWALRDAWVLL